MKRLEIGFASSGMAIMAMVLAIGIVAKAQEPPAPQSEQRQQVADGKRRGLPIETYAVAPGTKFLVKLEDELGTRGTQENAKFKVKTLEPLEAGSGIYAGWGRDPRAYQPC